jgi:hypothetical protein
MDIGGSHHWSFTVGSRHVGDPFEDSLPSLAEEPAVPFSRLAAVAFSGFPGDSSIHSKVSEALNNEDVFEPPLFQILQGLSSFFSDFNQGGPYITLG